MKRVLTTDVVIIGAGPVGMTMAIDLAQRGIDVCVLERRAAGEAPSIKCNHISARSMEIFRRLGVVQKIRDVGLPHDYPNDVAYRTTMVGPDLARILIPCRRDRYQSKNGPDTWWPTPEPPHRVNQTFFEPVLFAAAIATRGVSIVNRVEYDEFVEAENAVKVRAHYLDNSDQLEIICKYLVGCDGGRSKVREQIGAKLSGDPVVQRVQSTYIRAPELINMLTTERAWANFAMNPRRSGNVYAIDGRATWLVHNYLRESEPTFDSVDRDYCIRAILGVGKGFKYEVLSNEDWYGRRLVADKFRQGRVFICGDAAHLWVPYAGYGMNAGLADGANLAWMLAATINGWGGENLLSAHERERQPITQQVSYYAMNHAIEMAKQRGGIPDEIEDQTEVGEQTRRRIGQAIYDLNVQQYCCAGLNFGYFYDNSPIIVYDGEKAPAYSMGSFTPSTVPGCRTPHIWLDNGSSLYDVVGSDYALLRFDPLVDVAPIKTAAAAKQVPLRIIDLPAHQKKAPFEHTLILSRPDQHIAWRGNNLPDNVTRLVDTVRGA